jgi:uncharacterized protein YwqG
LSTHVRAILELARPSVRIDARRCPHHALELGASRFGGSPDLPVDFAWPRYQGRPLAFLAQFNLSDLPGSSDSQLPQTGFLVVFYETESMKWGFDPADRGCSQVAFLDVAAAELKRTSPPQASPPVETFHPCALSFAPQIDLPSLDDIICDQLNDELVDEQGAAYVDVASGLHAETYHHLLGHAQIIQNDMRVECELASNGVDVGTPDGYARGESMRAGASDWELLLQIDTDEEGPGWMWGDVGRLYLWLRTEDLVARRFEMAWLVLQCG